MGLYLTILGNILRSYTQLIFFPRYKKECIPDILLIVQLEREVNKILRIVS